jgi:histidinol-phosphatase (PHP family)
MNFDKQYRMDILDKNKYEKDILNLKEIYKDKIEILVGYEVDFLKGNYILDEIKIAKVDYLIGSIHFINDDWGFDNPEFIGKYKNQDIDKIWEDYFDSVEDMVKTKYFNIVGHLDLIKVFKFLPKQDIKKIALNCLKMIKKTGMVLEINSAGLRKPIKEQYPSIPLLELAFELDIPITFGSDAHNIQQIGFKYDIVKKIAKEIGYNTCVSFRNKEKYNFKF